ncbi:LptA/OstA family protein [Rhodobaculum claviforme]|uniref:Organic solvent tolerance-like N-terminal domain-containing protein n=1 Tax=Rhodobaculum claviforme TaxID=1549854 RepID=A0A934TMU0_9RHOB|nr:LptA/OstA family protein [Rhodobaculum claviforme]MBK5928777.1 hypothetical protein [Rhodobaculum claviforme]
MPRPLCLLAVLVCLVMPASLTAQTQVPFAGLEVDRDDPVEIVAAALDVDQQSGRAIFTGEVLVAQGAMRLAADRLRVDYAEGGEGARSRISSMNASGNVILTTPEEVAEGAEAVYDLDSGQVTISGDVLLLQGGNVLAGDRLVIDLATGTGRMEGQVRTLLQPGRTP